MLLRAFRVLTIAALCLPQICLASVPDCRHTDQTEDIAAGSPEDPKCPQGLYPGFESNVWQFTVPASTWINRTGSYFDSEWYVGPINSTAGKDNTIGATRTMLFENALFTEHLVGYYRSPTHSVLRYSLVNGPVKLRNITFYSYTEELRAVSICGGTATYYTMTSTYCTDDPVGMYNLYDVYRRGTVQAMADELRALVFSGTCPIR